MVSIHFVAIEFRIDPKIQGFHLSFHTQNSNLYGKYERIWILELLLIFENYTSIDATF